MRFKRPQPGSGSLDQLRPPPANLMVTTARTTQALDIAERAAANARLHVRDLDSPDQATREAAQYAVLQQIAQASGALHVLVLGQPSKVAQAYARGEKVVR